MFALCRLGKGTSNMQVAVVGTGNVGSTLLFHLADVASIDRILVMNLQEEWSHAAIMDVASARPKEAYRCEIAPFANLGEADIVVMTSGAQMKEGQTGTDVRDTNIQIMSSILGCAPLKPTAIVIGMATPVDDITAHIQMHTGLPRQQVFGFGGDLDRNRLAYVLRGRGFPVEGIHVVGEHGARVIPVYEGERDYEEVAWRVRHFLSDITAQGGSPRNLATGLLLARLIDSVISDRERLCYVSGYHPEHQMYLTWAYRVGRQGVVTPESVTLPPNAKKDLEKLIEQKRV